MPARKKRKAAKSVSAAELLSSVKQDDVAFGRLCRRLSSSSERAFKSAKRELERLRKETKKHTGAATRLRTRLANAKARVAKNDNATNRKAVRVTEKELASVTDAKKTAAKSLVSARTTHADAKVLAVKHKKYSGALAGADRALAKPARRKKRSASA